MDYQYLALVKDALVGSLGRLNEAIAQQDDYQTEAALRETRDRAGVALKASFSGQLSDPEWRKERARKAAKARWDRTTPQERKDALSAVRDAK